MTLPEVLYAYDLTLAQLAYQRFGRAPAACVAWEVISHTSDGILYVSRSFSLWYSMRTATHGIFLIDAGGF